MAIATSPTGSVSGTGTAGTIPIWSNSVTIGNSLLSQSTTTITLTGGATATNTGFYNLASINDFLQYDLKNTSTGTSAQSTYSLTADNGSLTTVFMSININNSTFTAVNNYSIGVANDCSVLASGQDLYMANSHISKDIIFSLGKTASPFFDERFRLQNASNVGGALFTLGNSLVVRKAATQDSVALAGRAGGTSSFANTITTAALTASRTLTLPDGDVTLTAGTSIAGSIANTQVAVGNGTNTVAGSANLTFNSGTNLVLNGGVGGSSSCRIQTTNTNAAGGADFLAFNDTGLVLAFQIFGASFAGSFAGLSNANLCKCVTTATGGMAFGTSAASALSLVTNSVVRATIASGGDVSITSTTNSSSSTTGSIVSGGGIGAGGNICITGQLFATFTGAGIQNTFRSLNSQAAGAGVGSYIQFQGIGSLPQAAIVGAWAGAATTDAYMDFYSTTGSTQTQRVRLSAAGNLLIGTTADTGLSGSGGLSVASTTDSTTTANGSIITAGGLGVAKRSFLGTIGGTFVGNVLAGVQSGAAAVAGQVGEVLSSTVTGVAVAATGTPGNITSISLTAGDWLISGYCVISGGANGLTASSTVKMSIVTTTGTNGTSGDTMIQESVLVLLANGLFSMAIPAISANTSATATRYLTVECTYVAGSPTVAATLTARRIR